MNDRGKGSVSLRKFVIILVGESAHHNSACSFCVTDFVCRFSSKRFLLFRAYVPYFDCSVICVTCANRLNVKLNDLNDIAFSLVTSV